MGFLKGVGSFFKRQAKTKTGKLAMVVAATALAPHVPVVGEQLPEFVTNVSNGMGGTEAALAAVGAMFLRDGAAKRGE